ncbi:MAG: glycosyltransferase family 39 protein [Candidatus Chisholmbacteria bacterium]|nr:glycosyltransferase family 39 protein [Candidatus Chisholmbacteria bacterium]
MSKQFFIAGLCLLGILAGGLRLFGLAHNPPALDWDEVSMGYNAYSILKTGRDEFGRQWPIYFRALDDDKLPMYTYLTAGSIAVFGYNDWAVRFPSAALGTLTVLVVGVLVYLLWADRRLAVIAAGLMAILPWQIQFSRMGSEVNVGLFWATLGVTLFVWGVTRRPIGLVGAVVSLGLAAYSHLSFRLLAPLLGLSLVWIYRQKLIKLKKRWRLILGGVGVVVGLVLAVDLWVHKGHVRMRGTSVFETDAAYAVFKQSEREMVDDASLGINLVRRLFHDSKWLPTLVVVSRGYLVHWAPTFLFMDFEEKQHQTPFVGLNYLWMLPFMVVGGYYLVSKGDLRGAKLMWWWLVLAPVPAAVTRDVPHAGRTLAMSVPLVVMTAFGLRFWLADWRKKVVVGLVAGVALIHYLHQYWVHLPQERSQTWQYGRKEMTEYLEVNKQSYDRIVVSIKLEWPYVFMLYYSQYDPNLYLAQGGTQSGGWGAENNRYGGYEFRRFKAEDFKDDKTLLVGLPDELEGRVTQVKVIYYKDGSEAVVTGVGRSKN